VAQRGSVTFQVTFVPNGAVCFLQPECPVCVSLTNDMVAPGCTEGTRLSPRPAPAYRHFLRALLASEHVSPETERIHSAVVNFVAAAQRPAVLDPGEEPLALLAGQWNLSEWNGRLILEAWDGPRNLVRRIAHLGEQKHDRLSLGIERFPKTPAELQIADLAGPLGGELARRTSRIAFRDRFRLLLAREYPAWKTVDLSSEPNLEASLSPAWVRACLRLGSTGLAIIAAPPDIAAPEDVVAFGLIWLEYLRRREKNLTFRPLLLYVPVGREKETALRVSLLNPTTADFQLFVYDERHRAARLDLTDVGNADSTLPPCFRPLAPNSGLPELPAGFPADQVHLGNGSVSLQIRGLEFARAVGGQLTCGFGRRKKSDLSTVVAMANEVARIRCAHSEDTEHPFYLTNPESWLESSIRQNPESLDATLRKSPIYGQVPIFHSAERGVIDLLGIDHTGRLTVIEIKASPSIPLPFQALDYWLRVVKHLSAGDFERLGYFPDMTISRETPRILLVAPASEFHSTSETLLAALPPHIGVTRLGLAANWRHELKVVVRLAGAARPI